jgi:hypothetical protein
LLELAVAFAACIAIPAFLARRLLHAGPGLIIAAAAAVIGALAILGLSLT